MKPHNQQILLVTNNNGRKYQCGKLNATFLADGEETNDSYSISRWDLAPHTPPIGAHQHAEHDDIFIVLHGQINFLIQDNWIILKDGDFIRVPINTTHDFCNHSDSPASVLNIFIPGGFEKDMPQIVEWFKQHN